MNLRATLLLTSFLLFPTFGFSADIQVLLQQEIDGYIEALNTTQGEALADVANRITGSGLSDQRLFDNVRDILTSKHQANLTTASEDTVVIHQIVTLLRTLASAGNKTDLYTINKILSESENRAIRNRAKHVMSKVGFYQARNTLMQNMDTHKEGQNLHSTRILNLLNTDDLIMNRFAAEEIVRQGEAEEVVQDWVYERLQQQVNQAGSKLQIDTLAWYCKVLGTVNKAKYSDFLTKITSDKSVDSKIRTHAKKILKS